MQVLIDYHPDVFSPLVVHRIRDFLMISVGDVKWHRRLLREEMQVIQGEVDYLYTLYVWRHETKYSRSILLRVSDRLKLPLDKAEVCYNPYIRLCSFVFKEIWFEMQCRSFRNIGSCDDCSVNDVVMCDNCCRLAGYRNNSDLWDIYWYSGEYHGKLISHLEHPVHMYKHLIHYS